MGSVPAVPGAEHLPPAVQVAFTILAFLGMALVYFRGIFKKPNIEVAKDVVVPNINVMDSAVLRQATEQLRASMRQDEDRAAAVREIARKQQEHMDLLQVLVSLKRREVELLEQIDNRLRQEHLRLREEGGGMP